MRKAKNKTVVEEPKNPEAASDPKYFAKTVQVIINDNTIRDLLLQTVKQHLCFTFKRGLMPVESMREMIQTVDECKPEEYITDAILKQFSVSLNVSQGDQGTWTAAYTPLGKK